jgi:hypothetical protein
MLWELITSLFNFELKVLNTYSHKIVMFFFSFNLEMFVQRDVTKTHQFFIKNRKKEKLLLQKALFLVFYSK